MQIDILPLGGKRRTNVAAGNGGGAMKRGRCRLAAKSQAKDLQWMQENLRMAYQNICRYHISLKSDAHFENCYNLKRTLTIWLKKVPKIK